MRLRFVAAGPVVTLLLLGGCSAVQTPEPACRPLEVAEFPLLGGIRGTWMDDERFVLADLHQSRLLVYGTSEGLVRIVNGWESEDLELNFVSPTNIQPWEDGYVLADGYADRDRLLGLGADLRPLRVLWESDIEKGRGKWKGEEVFVLSWMVALRDRLYVQASRLTDGELSEREYAEFGAARLLNGPGGALRELAAWPGFEGEREWHGSFHDLAATGGRAASAFALRFSPAGPFVQELVGEGRRLEAFPDLPAPMPVLPRDGPEGRDAFYAALEASSYPAGLYADEDSLYVLMRNATSGEPVWDLHRIDPRRDEVVDKVRLPTNAAHVSLLPGGRYWVLEESSSGLEGYFRPPIRFLLLSSAAIRAGEVPSCD
ncbi:MAG: hypothetical protein OXG74_06925 [Acidobacteria bacterium]|nr:hypothetical protein [Acidobacteriota bacterium]